MLIETLAEDAPLVAEPVSAERPKLVVLAGAANKSEIPLQKARTNIGRLLDVYKSEGLSRRNDLAFAEDNPINRTVSREHAHIVQRRRPASTGCSTIAGTSREQAAMRIVDYPRRYGTRRASRYARHAAPPGRRNPPRQSNPKIQRVKYSCVPRSHSCERVRLNPTPAQNPPANRASPQSQSISAPAHRSPQPARIPLR